MKLFQFKCRFCNENISYDHNGYMNKENVYSCKSGKCFINNQSRYIISVDVTDFTIMYEVILYKNNEVQLRYGIQNYKFKFTKLSIDYINEKATIINSDFNHYDMSKNQFNLNLDKVKSITSYDKLFIYTRNILNIG